MVYLDLTHFCTIFKVLVTALVIRNLINHFKYSFTFFVEETVTTNRCIGGSLSNRNLRRKHYHTADINYYEIPSMYATSGKHHIMTA